MTPVERRILYWTPRALSIAFIGFLSLFALDVFSESYGFWETLIALFMHLIPSFILIVVLVLAWRWEWIGAALFAVGGALYIAAALTASIPPQTKLVWIVMIAVPALIIAALFLANWLKRDELRSASPER